MPSSSTATIARGRKRDLLARYGLREYWVVEAAEHRVEVSVLRATGYEPPPAITRGAVESPTVPGLAIDLTPLFEGP